MNILLALDSFKEALSATDACEALSKGLRQGWPEVELRLIPLADGGEGTARLLTQALQGEWITSEVQDPLGRPITAGFGLSGDGQQAFIDLAEASGLQHLRPEERDPARTHTFGTGQLIRQALDRGARHILLGIGGSATNDAGMGMARALGWRFLDHDGKELSGGGGDLIQVHSICEGPLLSAGFTILCDVQNPLYGPTGAAHVYAPQKGADAASVKTLDEGLRHFADRMRTAFGVDDADLPGAGAAGGMGFGAKHFLRGSLKPGIVTILQLLEVEKAIAAADLIITGEGKLDAQTAQGKLISGVCDLAQRYDKPVIAVCGALEASPSDLQRLGLTAAFSVQTKPLSLEEALASSPAGLENIGFQLAALINALDKK